MDPDEKAVLQHAWSRIPLGKPFSAESGTSVVVLSRGRWNPVPGPDFLGVQLLLDGVRRKGAVEISSRTSDRIRKGHALDTCGEKVILRAAACADSLLARDPVPVLILPCEEISDEECRSTPCGNCAAVFAALESRSLRRFFLDAGLERITAEADDLLQEMLSSGTGQAFLRILFRRMGSGKNGPVFLSLFEDLLKHRTAGEEFPDFEAIIWGESGLLPSDEAVFPDPEAKQQLRTLWERWWKLRQKGCVRRMWKRGGLRPLNSPERGIAALAAFVRKNGSDPIPRWAESLRRTDSPEAFAQKLAEAFRCTDPFWDGHTDFSSEKLRLSCAVIGESRARALAVDAGLPALMAYARLIRDGKLLSRLRLAAEYLPPTTDNAVTREAFSRWFRSPLQPTQLFADACSRQGVLHLYQRFCQHENGVCRNCPLSQKAVLPSGLL